jgi:hypothetical protein
MSRGLGQVQIAALEYLHVVGEWQYVHTLTNHVHERLSGTDMDCKGFCVPVAFNTSVRRALRQLEKRDLVNLGYHFDGAYRYRTDAYSKLVCWLPGHTPPKIKTTVPGKQIEKMILDHALRITEAEIEESFFICGKFAQSARWEPGAIPYALIVGRVMKDLQQSRYSEGWAYTAISRAVTRLLMRGEIKAAYYRGNRWGWIKPPEHKRCDESVIAFTATLNSDQ